MTLAFIAEAGPTHPSLLAASLGSQRVINAWGGYSQKAKQTLERLHHLGYLRVARRDNGIRVYEKMPPLANGQDPSLRFEKILAATLDAFGPTSRRFLLSETARFSDLSPTPKTRSQAIDRLLKLGQIESLLVDGIEYLCPVPSFVEADTAEDRLRILAPFDPLVRDRARFEHLWGWTYRFEAYTPAQKRKLGYYAMPVLWRGQVIGWTNATTNKGELSLRFGFVSGSPPKAKTFAKAAREEAERMASFLGTTLAKTIL